jgi:hypothetical protein
MTSLMSRGAAADLAPPIQQLTGSPPRLHRHLGTMAAGDGARDDFKVAQNG